MALLDMIGNSGPSHDEMTVDMPTSYRETADWVPKLGDIFPNFHARTTEGRIDFYPWAEGAWTVLLGYPKARGGISESEVASLNYHNQDFAQRNTKTIGLSPATLGHNIEWVKEIEDVFQQEVTIPLIADDRLALCKSLGMIQPKDPTDVAIRKTMIIDPSLRLRWMAEYPTPVGRSVEELLRVLDALQHFDKSDLGTPVDWQPGEASVVRPDMDSPTARARYGNRVNVVTPNIRMVTLPVTN